MTRKRIPDAVLETAHARARARAARDWREADRLKGEIEAAGWKVVDRGTDFALSPAKPPDVAADGQIRYGSSSAVPSRLADPPTGLATVVLVVADDGVSLQRVIRRLEETSPARTSVVIVADGPGTDVDAVLDEVEARVARGDGPLETEIVRTSERLGPAAALNIGIRRARGPIVIVVDPAIELAGDLVSPLVQALDDPSVAVAGRLGRVAPDHRHFEDAPPGDVDVIDGSLLAFRRADAADRGPVDERLRTDFYTAVWWSLMLRDEGHGATHRRAVALPNVPATREDRGVGAAPSDANVGRDMKRDFYRFLDRFGARLDLFGEPDRP